MSPEMQRDKIEQWATFKDVEIVAWHRDEDQSGGTHSRPGLEAAIARCLAGETGGIVAANIDRFSRTTELGLRELRRLEAADARLAFVTEDIDTGTVYGRMIYTILLAVAEAFLANIKANWQVVKARAVARGAYVSRTPWGYARNDDGTLSPHPERAACVVDAFHLAGGHSLRAATEYLERVAPERGWNATKTRRLLAQRSYLGETRNGDLVQADTHEPLVSRAVWEAAQSTPAQRGSREHFPLSGVMLCGTCRSPMVGSRGGAGQRTYRCASSQSQADGCERPANVTARIAEDYLINIARDALDGFSVEVSDPNLDRFTLAERAMREAEAELDAFAADLALRRALGERYHEHLRSRADAVERARSAYREMAREHETRLALSSGDLLQRPDGLGLVLRSIFAAVLVAPGRNIAIVDRLTLIPFRDDGTAGVVTPDFP